MSTTLAINKDDEVRLVPVPLGPGESLSWPSDLTGRHVFTISWQEKPLQIMAGSFRPLRLWDQKIVREDGKHTKAEPPTLHNYCGPFTVRVKRVIDFPIKPFTPDMLKVMARVGNRCDILDVSVRWEIAEPAITRMTGVKKLTFHLGNVEDVGKLLDWLASPRAKDDRPNLPFLYTLNITCDGGCDLDKLVKCFVQRRSSEKVSLRCRLSSFHFMVLCGSLTNPHSIAKKTQKSEYLTIGSIPGFVQCICQVCGQRVISGDGQKRHRLSHLSDDAPKAEETKRPHRCRYCMQGFAQNGTMLSHIRAKQGPKSNPTSQKSVARGQASKKRQVTPTTAMPQTDDASTAETTQAPTPPESELRPTAPPHSSSTPRVPFNAPSFPFTFAADTTGAVDFFSINSSEQHVDSLDATPAGAFTLPDHDSLHGYGEEYAAALKMQAPASDFVNEFLPQVKIEPDFAETFDDPGSLAHPFAPIAPSFGSIFSDSTSFPITPTPTLLTRATAAASTSAAVPYDITSTPETSIANSASSSSWYFERNLDACNFDALQSGFDADANYDANFEASTYHWQQMLEPCPHAAGEFFEHEGLASSYAPATAYDDVGEQNLTEMRLQMLYATQTKEYTTQASAYAMDHGGWPTQAYNGEGSSSVDYSASYFGTFTPSCRFDDWP
ncbi:uncharacterized protein SCHCODRAFT_02668365 [Schizophyllum commune H4-8]|uniref:C2H2-type domain-containing protein n=1 Tax=Schizophyllum commune (strain H4-8 / FGSC 9210) TaxID=578458 RepID=D8Q6J5_SCHCM|nr:uncharacterized protein SCHCODRAFT_02668365 [Schizophyllum commune H4-8]KAI5890914.1 hypothetical protein SCHCODRAFT_02668365 [Schizophyllum commune H4-8]